MPTKALLRAALKFGKKKARKSAKMKEFEKTFAKEAKAFAPKKFKEAPETDPTLLKKLQKELAERKKKQAKKK